MCCALTLSRVYLAGNSGVCEEVTQRIRERTNKNTLEVAMRRIAENDALRAEIDRLSAAAATAAAAAAAAAAAGAEAVPLDAAAALRTGRDRALQGPHSLRGPRAKPRRRVPRPRRRGRP